MREAQIKKEVVRLQSGKTALDRAASSNLASSSKTPDSTWNREFFFCLLVQSMLELPFLNSSVLQRD